MSKDTVMKSLALPSELNYEMTQWAEYFRMTDSEFIRGAISGLITRSREKFPDAELSPPLPSKKRDVAYIYALHSGDKNYRYIGQTRNPKARLAQHRTHWNKPEVFAEGSAIQMSILEEVSVNNSRKVESEYIIRYRQTNDLCNELPLITKTRAEFDQEVADWEAGGKVGPIPCPF